MKALTKLELTEVQGGQRPEDKALYVGAITGSVVGGLLWSLGNSGDVIWFGVGVGVVLGFWVRIYSEYNKTIKY